MLRHPLPCLAIFVIITYKFTSLFGYKYVLITLRLRFSLHLVLISSSNNRMRAFPPLACQHGYCSTLTPMASPDILVPKIRISQHDLQTNPFWVVGIVLSAITLLLCFGGAAYLIIHKLGHLVADHLPSPPPSPPPAIDEIELESSLPPSSHEGSPYHI
ncbi:hypothetical protein CJ030_MR0G027002 [Morella rubra]|uniref:Uncharacterized protein n=1 Tax=Morella rubra TaxID=262757 RepID=A0A6A1UJ95_9ROSI|nr:hypothetical protein CJ030_MR0G027002 [Morella rubra]